MLYHEHLKVLRYGTPSRNLKVLPVTQCPFSDGMNNTCLCLLSHSRSSATDSGGMEGRVKLGTVVDTVMMQMRLQPAVTHPSIKY